jgi:hypothetical protein
MLELAKNITTPYSSKEYKLQTTYSNMEDQIDKSSINYLQKTIV